MSSVRSATYIVSCTVFEILRIIDQTDRTDRHTDRRYEITCVKLPVLRSARTASYIVLSRTWWFTW